MVLSSIAGALSVVKTLYPKTLKLLMSVLDYLRFRMLVCGLKSLDERGKCH